ncbi:MAG: TlpA family protein disulfide reductase, partial [Cyclobacteriaceae bacterium]
MNRFLMVGLILMVFGACKPEAEISNALKTGIWRAVVEIQAQQLPFNLEVTRNEKGGYHFYLINAAERLLLDEVYVKEDSINIVLHVFDADIKARISGDSLTGTFSKNYKKDYHLPFRAVHGQGFRFEGGDKGDAPDFSGKYDVTFL